MTGRCAGAAVAGEWDAREAQSAHPRARNILTYLAHIEAGTPIRQLAREAGCHASTIHRRIRRIEALRDDVLYDQAMAGIANRLSHCTGRDSGPPHDKDPLPMAAELLAEIEPKPSAATEREAMRILRRLAEPGACLAYARDMEKAVVVRETADDRTVRTAVTDSAVAEVMALRDWLCCQTKGRVSRYRITSAGRSALRRAMADEENARAGLAERGIKFADQHREWDEKAVAVEGSTRTARMRYNAAESPVSLLGRRKGKDGQPILSARMVTAAERLREDFELAQMGPRVVQNWDKFLTGGDRGRFQGAGGGGQGAERARDRVSAAMSHLGPGLGDVVLRVCCFLEGLEAAERRLGWSARSGKIVLRIALDRLAAFYDQQGGQPMIGEA